MMIFPFSLDESYNTIVVDVLLDGFDLRLMVDTGASHTVIDLTTLLINGYSFSQRKKEVKVETAKGVAIAHVFEVKSLEGLSIKQSDFEICSYDFLGNGILSEYDGVLGIDFFFKNKICIDFVKSEITIS
jgi:Aspartyl protease